MHPPGADVSDVLHGAEIRHMAALVAVAGARSFSTAARRLGCAQSTLSEQLNELERAAGARLVERGRGGGSDGLTEAGRLLLEHAKAVVARVGAARADLEALERAPYLRVGVCETVATHVVETVLRAQPEMSIVPSVAGDDSDLLQQIERGSVDLSLVTLPLPPGPLDVLRLLDEPYVLVVPSQSELADRPVTPPAASVPLVARTKPAHGSHVEAALAAAGWNFEIIRHARTDAEAHAFVSAGSAAAILPRSSVDASDPATVVLELGPGLPPRTIGIAWHRYRRLPPTAERFRQAAVAACATLEDRPA
jgi:DNA-binding transcriptional LysR family regulator